ncbi:hypothetical protein Hanom_Chr12g01181891 [Helianthus anomalus]
MCVCVCVYIIGMICFCRRLLYDGRKGVTEALNETVCVVNDCRGLAVSQRGGPVDPQKLVVELAPMEIRTFIVTLGKTLSRRLVSSDISLQ